MGNREVRINRLLEELEKYKVQLTNVKQGETEKLQNTRKDAEFLLAENKKLERQKNELLIAFKKQQKLIDLLKRMKTHLEAARMLQFTEEEFLKTLEIGQHF